jgi:multiple sugar transport system substrate-binding protein
MQPPGKRSKVSDGRTVAGGGPWFGGNSLSRRDFLRLGGVGLAGVALLGASACGGPEATNEVVLSYAGDAYPQVGLIKKFNERHKDGFRVTVRVMPNDYGDYFEKLKTEFQVGGGGIDVILGDIIWVAEFAANDWLSDLSGRFSAEQRSAFVDGTIRSFTYGGQIYGVPRFLDAGMLFYRKDLLEESGFSEPPKTWEELKEMAGKVVRDQGTTYGYVFQGADYEGGVCNGLEFIWTHGGEVLDPNDPSNVIIASPESVAALATERSMVSDGVAPQGVANYREYESEITFAIHGDAVFCRHWPYMYEVSSWSESKVEPGQVGFSPLPVADGQHRTASCLGGDVLLISAFSEMKEEAWEFVRFFANEVSQKTRALEANLLPTRKALYHDREVTEALPMITGAREALLNVRPRPVSGNYSEMSSAMALQFNNILRGNTMPDEAVQTLQDELQQIVERGQ